MMPPDDNTPELPDTSPLCFVCGWPMEWTGEEREIELEGGELIVYEPVYECVNPDCQDEDED